MAEDELLYRVALTFVPGIGDVLSKKLVHLVGEPRAIFTSSRKILQKIPRINENLVKEFGNKAILLRAEQELSFIQKYNIKPLYFLDESYPTRLRNCIDSPVLLYYKGSAELNKKRVLGFVGTRRATDYGKEICYRFIEELKSEELLIVSGLAYGIDSFAHRSAIENGVPTIGVLGHGLDRVYPSQNRNLAEKMVQEGGLLTDYPSQTKPDRENFPRRNRIIAGMVDALVVVEAAVKGGALITADIANSYNRDVFAIPGRLGDLYSEGCNELIKRNEAALIQTPYDIFDLMGWIERPNTPPIQQRKIFIELTPEEEQIVEVLKQNHKLAIDEIMIQTSLSMSKCSSALLNLEFEGVVKSSPGRVYELG